MRYCRAAAWLAVLPMCVFAAGPEGSRPPIIDVHVHALPLDFFGLEPVQICSGAIHFLPRDGAESFTIHDVTSCDRPLSPPPDDAANRAAVLNYLEALNITAIVSGPLKIVHNWRAAAPQRVLPAVMLFLPGNPPVQDIRAAIAAKDIVVLGEVMTQYPGVASDAAELEPYFALAEEQDIPVALHMGLGAPAAAYVGQSGYRSQLTSPLSLEPVLLKHPRLRIYVMHAGWPLLDEMIHLMYSHPQVYVDTGIISYGIPRPEFHHYLRRLVEAGFSKRILFGSDQMIWPDAIPVAIEAVESAPFLTAEQKRDIFYDNAVRFLRLDTLIGGERK